MAEQLVFDWPRRIGLGRDDFFVTDANHAALAMVSAPDAWPNGKLCVTGPKGCGKTHLARLFQQENGGRLRVAAQIEPETPLPESGILIIEDVDQLPKDAEEWLFHAHNRLIGNGLLLLTAQSAPSRWDITLPDLKSRMEGTALISIDPPDDQLLAAVLMKQFSDRQLSPAPSAMKYLLRHMERSFDMARRIVLALDRAALTFRQPINLPLARAVLIVLQGRPQDEEDDTLVDG